MRNLAQRLIAEEIRTGKPTEKPAQAAFRVCEKLRRPLATLTGLAGFRSLLSRALALARAEEPWLNGVKVGTDGALQHSPESETTLDTEAAALAGTALVNQLIGLLITFIGDTLTLRLVQEVWPKVALKDSDSTGN